MTTCKNCSESFEGKFCPNCGTIAHVKRIDKHYILHELEHSILHLENGILFTLKELLIRPGKTIRNFIEGEKERFKHFKPLGFLIITSLVYGFISHKFGYYEAGTEIEGNAAIINWIESHNNYANLIAIAYIALGLKYVFYKKRNYNLFEYFVLMAFVTGQIMVFGIFAEIISGITHSETPTDIYHLISILYCSWSIGSFFNVKSFWGYLKAFFAYNCCLLGLIITVYIVDAIIGTFHF
jgi:hypothetical protein